jgi:carboxyl-terminal processing protease
MDRYTNGELQSADSISVIDSLAFKTPKGKIVYGGGGIIPDVFVAKDQNDIHVDLYDMFEGGILDRFIFDELEKNRSFYNEISEDTFTSQYEVSQGTMSAFKVFLATFNISYDNSEEYRNIVKTYLKATIARQLFDSNLAYKIIVNDDAMIKKSLETNLDNF